MASRYLRKISLGCEMSRKKKKKKKKKATSQAKEERICNCSFSRSFSIKIKEGVEPRVKERIASNFRKFIEAEQTMFMVS
jgi:hypothetical protein